ncbi:MAG: mannosyltransferase family protein [Chloroflexota bacterium]
MSERPDYVYASATAPALDRPLPRPGTPIERAVGRTYPAVASRVSLDVLVQIVGLFVVWRTAIMAISVAWGRLPVVTQWPAEIDVMWLWRYSVRWDSGWYLTIANNGYQYDPQAASSVAFFPLFPLLIRAFDAVLPGSDVLAALIVVHLALFGALLYIYKLLRIDYGNRMAMRTIYFLLIFPGAFFLTAVYNESLLLFTIAGALYHARRGQWLLAGLFGIGASATKLVGVMLIVPLAVELASQRGSSWRNIKPGAWIAIAPLGTLAYFGYLQAKFDSFRVFFDTEGHWHRDAFTPVLFMGIERLMGVTDALSYYPANTTPLRSAFLIIDTTLLWIFLISGVILWVKHRPTYGALVIAFAMVPALSGSPQSLNRYLAVLFPAFLLLAQIRSEAMRHALTFAFVVGMTFTTYLFVNGYWAG